MLVWLSLVLTDQQLLPCPSGKFLRFLFCFQERLLSDTRSIRCKNPGFPSPPGLLSALPPHSCLTPALFIPGASSQASQNSLHSSSILKWIALLSLATTSVSSTHPSAPCCHACWGGGFCTFWDLEQACLGVPMSRELSAWRRVVVLSGESLGWALGTSKTVRRDHLVLGESPLLNSSS